MHWQVKGVVQKLLGVVPYGASVHYLLQRSLGGLRAFEAECDTKFEDFGFMIGHFRTAGVDPRTARFLEIGTGWYPTFPVCLYLMGAPKVFSFDLQRHLRPELQNAMVRRLRDKLPALAEWGKLPLAEVRAHHDALLARLDEGVGLSEASRGCIDYRAPADAAATGLPPGSVDVAFSNSVLEHVPRAAIVAMFAEMRRVLSPRGVMFHSVNCGDHYAYFDRHIDQLHYLRYSESRWAFWNNAFLYQNRLRAEDFTGMARDAGFVVEVDTSRPHPMRLQQLGRIDVAACFAGYSREQLAITSIDFVARAPA